MFTNNHLLGFTSIVTYRMIRYTRNNNLLNVYLLYFTVNEILDCSVSLFLCVCLLAFSFSSAGLSLTAFVCNTNSYIQPSVLLIIFTFQVTALRSDGFII